MTFLNVEKLNKSFDGHSSPVVHNMALSVEHKQMLAILGPSGCGKTTALRLIAGLEHADSGDVILANQNITKLSPQKRHIGFVFQDYALFPHLSVLENITFGLTDLPEDIREQRARTTLAMVKLTSLANRKPHTLSGGQQQRVALARTLAPRPKLILLDEPFSNLDNQLRESARDEVRRLLKANHMSAILVTHDQEEALSFADVIAVMQEGKILQIGEPETIYRNPHTRFVAEFLGTANIFSGMAHGLSAQTPLGTIHLQKPAEGNVNLMLRPESLKIRVQEDNTSASKATVIRREFKGSYWVYSIAVGELEVKVKCDCHCNYQGGETVSVSAIHPAWVLTS